MVPLNGSYFREKKSKEWYTHGGPAGEFFESLFPSLASRKEGRKASSGQTEEQHACFSWPGRGRGIPILAYTLGTRALQACRS